MYVIGRATFLRVSARRAFLGARSPTQFFHVSKHRPIWRESMARLLLMLTWHLLSEAAPAFLRLARNAGFDISRNDGFLAVESRTAAKPCFLDSKCNLQIRLAFRNRRSLKRDHASPNLKTQLVGSSSAGCRCNYLRCNRLYASGYGCCNARAVFWSVGID